MGGYNLYYAGTTRSLVHHGSYPQAVTDARDRAARTGRTIQIRTAWDGSVYSVVSPDGSVSAPVRG